MPKFRFPFLASEIFNCEINAILDKFFDAPEKKKPAPPVEEVNKEESVPEKAEEDVEMHEEKVSF